MLVDSEDIQENSVLTSDLCIIGGGAAGITLARELKDQNISTILLEGEGFNPSLASQKLYRGEEAGTVLGEGNPYLISSRLRYFGSTGSLERRTVIVSDVQRNCLVRNSESFLRGELKSYSMKITYFLRRSEERTIWEQPE